MIKFNSSKKILSGILIAVMISLNFSFIAVPKRAEAIPTITIGNTWQIAMDVLAAVVRKTVIKLVLRFANSIADWITNGFQGNPSFLNDPQRFAKGVMDEAIGQFIWDDPALSFLCRPFQLQLRLSLALQHQSFYKSVDCTLSGVVKNVTKSYNSFAKGDFVGGGGWGTFLTIVSNPNSSPEGAFLVMDNELTARIEDKQGVANKELAQGSGSLSFRNCTETTYNVSRKMSDSGNVTETKTKGTSRDYTGSMFYDKSTTTPAVMTQDDSGNDGDMTGTQKETTCKITSPGALIAARLSSSQESGQKIGEMQAAMGQAFDVVIGALTDYIVNQVMGAVLNSGNHDQQYANLDDQIAQLRAQQSSISNSDGTINQATYNSITGNTSPTDPLNSLKNSASSTISNQIAIETVYWENQSRILNYLDNIRSAFASTSQCNYQYNGSPANIIALQDILNKIDGVKDPSTGIFLSMPTPNKVNVGDNMTAANSNLSILNSRLNTVINATSSTIINSQLNGIGNYPFHTALQANDLSTTTDIIHTQAVSWSMSGNIPNVCTTTVPMFSN